MTQINPYDMIPEGTRVTLSVVGATLTGTVSNSELADFLILNGTDIVVSRDRIVEIHAELG